MLHKAMIEEAKADPDIKTFGDTKAWQDWTVRIKTQNWV